MFSVFPGFGIIGLCTVVYSGVDLIAEPIFYHTVCSPVIYLPKQYK